MLKLEIAISANTCQEQVMIMTHPYVDQEHEFCRICPESNYSQCLRYKPISATEKRFAYLRLMEGGQND